jgi:hypothetical protein
MLATSPLEDIVAASGRLARLRVSAAPPPVPGAGQIVVRRRFSANLPAVGAAGTVIATGDGVTRLAVGDEVFGRLQGGAGASRPYALTDADGPHIELRPEDLEPAAAAALVEPGLTAKTIVRAAGVQHGQRVLVIGASGAVGLLLVPLLAEAGASVIVDDAACDAIEALGRHPDVDLLVDLVSFDEPYLLMAHAVPSCGALVGPLPGREADAQGPGLPRIQVCAEPGDLLDLAQRAPGAILDVDAVEADVAAPMAGEDTADSDWITIAA